MQVTLEELQLGRSLLHRQAEAAIKEADAQIKLNKGQCEHVGRLLVHAKVANHISIEAVTWRENTSTIIGLGVGLRLVS